MLKPFSKPWFDRPAIKPLMVGQSHIARTVVFPDFILKDSKEYDSVSTD
jgi:predicted RNA-binding protein